MYNPDLPSGYDVRDHLSSGDLAQRLGELMGMFEPVPDEWLKTDHKPYVPKGNAIACSDYGQLITAWRKALKWRRSMDDVLSVMLAVALSTEQIGDQLFLMVIGDAGSGKTRLCDGMLTSGRCYPLEHLTGFHSGWKDDSGEDFSLINRVNRKTMITPEGDVMISSPHFVEIMSQQRRIFDGTSGASYKNRKEDMRYTGLRTPWIIAGTPALLDTDQSRLGDRFLKVFIDPPTEEEKREILWRVGYTALQSVKMTSDGSPDKHVDQDLYLAYTLTGGYVEWLRDNTKLLSSVDCPDDALHRCALMAEFTANLRARPAQGKQEHHDTKELPTRLTHQFVRLALCLAVVLNRDRVDAEVLRRVRKVALDTFRGQTFAMVGHLYNASQDGLMPEQLALSMGSTADRVRTMLRFLRVIKVVEAHTPVMQNGKAGRVHWRLTDSTVELYRQVMTGE